MIGSVRPYCTATIWHSFFLLFIASCNHLTVLSASVLLWDRLAILDSTVWCLGGRWPIGRSQYR